MSRTPDRNISLRKDGGSNMRELTAQEKRRILAGQAVSEAVEVLKESNLPEWFDAMRACLVMGNNARVKSIFLPGGFSQADVEAILDRLVELGQVVCRNTDHSKEYSLSRTQK